jgi:hypothetical protein
MGIYHISANIILLAFQEPQQEANASQGRRKHTEKDNGPLSLLLWAEK